MSESTTTDFEAARGQFHDLRLNVANLTSRIHHANAKWWVDLHTGEPVKRNVGELLMLMVSELAEAMEGHRKNLPDDKLPHRPMIEVELADALIRICDAAAGLGLDLAGAVAEKMEFNAKREDHTREARLGHHGKKY
jgi:NTP pyrophosphatase (non-canonical NTP hydrolase)